MPAALDPVTAADDGMGLDLPAVQFLETPAKPITDTAASSPTSSDAIDSISDSDFNAIGIDDQVQLNTGIGTEFNDDELANIRAAMLEYSPQVKKAIIDIVVHEKVSQAQQRVLMNMLIKRASIVEIADFIEVHLGYRPAVTGTQYTKDGVEVLYTDQLSPEEVARRRRRKRLIAIGFGLSTAAAFTFFVGIALYQRFFVQGLYEKGLAELTKARYSFVVSERDEHKKRAESYFQQALQRSEGHYDVEYLNRYGIAYMQARFYPEAFVKLFGAVRPAYGSKTSAQRWDAAKRRAPLVRLNGSAWQAVNGKGTRFSDQSNIGREVFVAGAYIVDRLRDNKLNKQTLLSLARFHSNITHDFTKTSRDHSYKNDNLAIDYYRLILTLLNKPNDVDAMLGIGDVYYNQSKLAQAARQYRKVTARFPLDLRANVCFTEYLYQHLASQP